MPETSNFDTVSTRQQRIAALAKQSPQMGFTSLNHHLDLPWLREAWRRTRKDGAVGVDGQTAREYEQALEENLQTLINRAKSGTYQAPPVRRVHIPKGTGSETRPIGIPTFEDKILQRAVAMVLEPIYEMDFYDCSYGFRPGRSAHQALQALWQQLMGARGGWVIEVDIRKFFDTLDHAHLRTLLQQRVRDGVILRLIGKWLNAGVMEEGVVHYPEAGSPQGGVVSPLLANVYLHYVLDDWLATMVAPVMDGKFFLIRYADDFVLGFENKRDARRVMETLPKRFGRFGLSIHPDKTRMIPFFPPASTGPHDDVRGRKGRKGTGSFDLLGFTHYWGRSLKGRWVVKRRTASKRLNRAIQAITRWCQRHRHRPMAEQHQALSNKVRGHYSYYGITGNAAALSTFQMVVTRTWRKWLSRRKRGKPIPWPRFKLLLARYPVPPVRVVHSVYRTQRNHD